MDPLTPADCDLRDFAFMPLDVLRLRDSDLAAEATGEEFRAAVLLWCASWHQVPAASLPDDDVKIAHLAGYGRAMKEWRKVRDGALRNFVKCSDGRLYHTTLADKAIEAWQSRTKFAAKREQDRERLQKWREEKRTGNEGETRFKEGLKPDGNNPETRKTVESREGIVSVANATAPIDVEKVMFDSGKAFLAKCGVPVAKSGPLLGKWKRDHGAGAVIEALGAAQREGAIDPISFIEGRWRHERTGTQSEYGPC